MRMKDNPVITDNFIFCLRELHLVFEMLEVLAKHIIDSGLDDIIIEAGIYGPTTFGEIIEGKHIKHVMFRFINYSI